MGEWEHPEYGKFNISEKTFDEIVKNFNNNIRKVQIPITFGHPKEEGVEPPAIGWFRKLIDKGKQGLFAVVEWTKDGYEKIKNQSYRYFSPEFEFNYKDPETSKEFGSTLMAGAVTNRPFLKGMKPIIASEQIVDEAKQIVNLISPTPQDVHIDAPLEIRKKKPEGEKYQQEGVLSVEEILKLQAGRPPEEWSDEQLRAFYGAGWDDCISRAAEGGARDPEMMCGAIRAEKRRRGIETSETDTQVQGGEEGMADATVLTKLTEQSEKIQMLEKKIKEKEVDEIVKKAIKDGKITPAMRDSWARDYASKDMDGFKKFVETSSAKVNLSELGREGETEEEGKEESMHEKALKLASEKNITYKEALLQLSLSEKPKALKEVYSRPTFSRSK